MPGRRGAQSQSSIGVTPPGVGTLGDPGDGGACARVLIVGCQAGGRRTGSSGGRSERRDHDPDGEGESGTGVGHTVTV